MLGVLPENLLNNWVQFLQNKTETSNMDPHCYLVWSNYGLGIQNS